jgi:hypothetical protein
MLPFTTRQTILPRAVDRQADLVARGDTCGDAIAAGQHSRRGHYLRLVLQHHGHQCWPSHVETCPGRVFGLGSARYIVAGEDLLPVVDRSEPDKGGLRGRRWADQRGEARGLPRAPAGPRVNLVRAPLNVDCFDRSRVLRRHEERHVVALHRRRTISFCLPAAAAAAAVAVGG